MLRLWRRRRESSNSDGLAKGKDSAVETTNSGHQVAGKDSPAPGSGSIRSSKSGSQADRERGSPVNYTRLTRPSRVAARWREAREESASESSDEESDTPAETAAAAADEGQAKTISFAPETNAPMAAAKTSIPMSMKGKGIAQAMEELKSPVGMGMQSVLPNQMNLNSSANYTSVNTDSLDTSMLPSNLPSVLPSAPITDTTVLQDISAQDIVVDDEQPDEDEQQSPLVGRVTEKLEKKDPSVQRRKVAFDSAPRSAVKWRGLGLSEAAKESKQVNIMRAADKTQAKTVQAQKRPGMGRRPLTASLKGKIGTLMVTVIEAKGLPKVDEAGGVESFVYCRLFATGQTTKPQFEDESQTIRGEDVLAKTLKIQWLADFAMDVNSDQSMLEVEIMVADIQAHHDSIGRLRLPVKVIMEEGNLDNWYMLKRVDGGLTSATVHIAASYTAFVEDPKEKRKRRQQELAAAAEEANLMPELPDWISVWDVRAVKEWETAVKEARKQVEELLDEETFEALKKASKVIKSFALQGEENSELVREKLEELRAEAEQQKAVKKRLQQLLSGAQTSAVWLMRSLRETLSDAGNAKMNFDYPEVVEAFKLLQLLEKHQQAQLAGMH